MSNKVTLISTYLIQANIRLRDDIYHS